MENHEHHNHDKMDHSKMDHSKMQHDHGSIPMGMPGHDHHKMMIKDFRKRFWVSTILTIPILIFSPMIQEFFGYEWMLPGNKFWLFGLSSIVYFWGGWPFLKGFYDEIRAKGPAMMTLISLA
ncbi:MAG TPA: heavy metal translocating P-type ATPase, partial [Cryomorphaceae bacterium]|nr:heavy metal translocating P-type ATPase [Cryomorphaceae bacterium]